MNLTGLHFLLTYQCTLECDHCFVWGSPKQSGVMTLSGIREILRQAANLGTVRSIYFEGGEPFLYYAVLLEAVREAAGMGFEVGIVTNGYWANSAEDSLAALKPFAGLVSDLAVSSDLFHSDQMISAQAAHAGNAARALGIPPGLISVAQPDNDEAGCSTGQIPEGESGVMYRGRAAATLAGRAPSKPWEQLDTCPYENLREPGRLHVDPMGNLHLCQGIMLGNIYRTSLAEICSSYNPEKHPIAAPLVRGGPAELRRSYQVATGQAFADACHLCYTVRDALRRDMPEFLGPDQMYGIKNS